MTEQPENNLKLEPKVSYQPVYCEKCLSNHILLPIGHRLTVGPTFDDCGFHTDGETLAQQMNEVRSHE